MKTKPKAQTHPMRTNEVLVIEPAKSWRRLQAAKSFFAELDELRDQQHRQFLEALMGYERQGVLRVQPYERSPQRQDQANGFYERDLGTRSGLLHLRVPRTRSGQFQTQVLVRYARREPVVDQALRAVFLAGVSTRQTGRALAGLLDEAVSASTVSTVSQALDATVLQWHRRELADAYQYLFLDGVSGRIRRAGRVQRRVALCAYGITRQGKRELIDFLLVKGEAEDTWHNFLSDLWRRGLQGKILKLITTDGHPGLIAALGRLWPQVAHQRCWAHKLRNLENKLKASQAACLHEAKPFYQAASQQEALRRFRAWKRRWQKSAPKAVACVEEDLEELFRFYEAPKKQWRRIRTTNVIERLFVEVRRRIRTMGAFTTRSSCERILSSVFFRMNQHWSDHPLKAFTQMN